jgi:sulfite reductase (ferredoxin)
MRTLFVWNCLEYAPSQFRIIRVPAGVYEQRENGTYMLRVCFPAGGATAPHLRRLGEVAAKFGNGLVHTTMRQEFQIHCVLLDDIIPALRWLAEAGLSTKGGGGNTVRNITASVDSGVCRDAIFDVTPYAMGTSERLLADPLSLQLPRKYKIAFAACDKDFSGATVLHRAQTKRRGRLCGLCRRRHGRQNPAGQPAA